MRANGSVRLAGVAKHYGAVTALKATDLEIRPSEFFALLGPSGSGKTTTLRLIAGLETPSAGRIFFEGADVTDLAPGERDIAMVFQSYALYPHMTVAENIAFPLRMVGTPRAEMEKLTRETAARVRIDHLLDRRPGQLSGGQQQRCALARAIVRKPRLFLLDEPLSNLDAKLRLETRVELKSLQRNLNVTAVYVTHDQEEAMTLADRMAVFLDGAVIQMGSPAEIFDRPETIDVAGFIGSPPMNLVPGRVDGGHLTVADVHVPLPGQAQIGASDVVVGVRPGDVTLAPAGLSARVYVNELLGETSLVNLRLGDNIVKMRVNGRSPFCEGDTLSIRFDPARIHIFDRQTRRRIESKA
jgi:ABC-type sugar transport system ATPase subunit